MRRTALLFNRFVRPLLLIGVVAASPALLHRILGSPKASVAALRAVDWSRADGTDSRTLVVAGLALLLWLTWVRLASSAAIVLTCRVLRLRIPHIPLLGVSQTVVAVLLGGAVVTGTAPTATSLSPAPAHGVPGGVMALSFRQGGVQVGWAETGLVAGGVATAIGVSRRQQRHRHSDRPEQTRVPDPQPVAPTAQIDTTQIDTTQIDTVQIDTVPDDIQVVRHRLRAPSAVSPLIGCTNSPEPISGVPQLPSWLIMVRLLGPVDALTNDGKQVVFERAKSLELLAWLALHRRCATREAARAALWDAEVRDTSFANVLSSLRRTLAIHAPLDREVDWVSRPRGERLALHTDVLSDVDLFNVHLERARRLERVGGSFQDRSGELRSALELVRGAPFIGSGFGWADSEASTSGFTLLVVSTALELAEQSLNNGRLDDVLWATSVGLSVLPGHEELVAIRLRSHAQAGDGAGVRHEWNTYVRSLQGDPWQTEPSPWMTDLVRGLLGESAVS